MKRVTILLGLAVLFLTPVVLAAIPQLINTQGVLRDGSGAPVPNASYSMTFRIYNAAAGGTIFWAETLSVPTLAGQFSVNLGSDNPIPDTVFNDTLRWLAIQVSPDAEMTPRSRLVSVGNAYRVSSVEGATGGNIFGDLHLHSTLTVGDFSGDVGRLEITDGASNTIVADGATGDLTALGKATIGPANINTGTDAFVAGNNNRARGAYSVVSGGGGTVSGAADSNAALGDYSVVAGGRQNTAIGAHATVGGGRTNATRTSGSTIGGGENNSAGSPPFDELATVSGGGFNTASGSAATIGGGGRNNASGASSTISGGSDHVASNVFATIGGGFFHIASGPSATIGGGGGNTASGQSATIAGGGVNIASGALATVGGGENNLAADTGTTVAGGRYNRARGRYSTVGGGGGGIAADSNSALGMWSTVSGGSRNVASGSVATIGGGSINTASNSNATVGGGFLNTASGLRSTVPGGSHNAAAADFAFAAGRRAKANHSGSFVWGDATDADFASSAANEFNIRAAGGTRIYSNSGLTAGVTLAAGASAWVVVSDSNLKRNIRTLDGKEMLEKVMQLPIKRWSYKAQDPNIEHIGPMAQDFYPLFQVGDDEKTISTIDPPGIALAAIQGLHQIVQEQKVEIRELRELVQKLLAEQEEKSAQVLTSTR